MTITHDWLWEHFTVGWYLKDDGSAYLDSPQFGIDPALVGLPLDPVAYNGETPVYAPLRQRLMDHGEMTIICPQCMEPSWAVTRHAAERHGVDVEVFTGTALSKRPDWFSPDWT